MIFVLGLILGIIGDIVPDATRGVGATRRSPLHHCVARIVVASLPSPTASRITERIVPRDMNVAVQSGRPPVAILKINPHDLRKSLIFYELS